MATGGVVNTVLIDPVEILYRGHNKALYTLLAASRTTAVTPNGGLDGTHGNLPTNRPLGVLPGMVASLVTISGEEFGAKISDNDDEPIGLFLLGYEGHNFENSPGVASNKVTIISAPAVVKIYIWEDRNVADNADNTYTVGTSVYSSPNGLVTSEAGDATTVVGIVNHAPTTAENWLGLELRV